MKNKKIIISLLFLLHYLINSSPTMSTDSTDYFDNNNSLLDEKKLFAEKFLLLITLNLAFHQTINNLAYLSNNNPAICLEKNNSEIIKNNCQSLVKFVLGLHVIATSDDTEIKEIQKKYTYDQDIQNQIESYFSLKEDILKKLEPFLRN